MKCHRCTTDNPEGSRFCNQCGYKFVYRTCGHLGCDNKEMYPDNEYYCPKCWNPMNRVSVQPSEILINMEFIKGEKFIMKENFDDGSMDCQTVTLNDFYISKYPINQAQWSKVMGTNPSPIGTDKNLPVVNISWFDCIDFCNTLNKIYGYSTIYEVVNGEKVKWHRERKGFRLPTEAEWVLAIEERGGKSKCCTFSNVSEWCWDKYNKYSTCNKINPTGSITGRSRVIRSTERKFERGFDSPEYWNNDWGVRIVQTL